MSSVKISSQIGAAKFIFSLINKAKELEVNRISFTLSNKEAFFNFQAEDGEHASSIYEKSISEELFSSIELYLSTRTFRWPDIEDDLSSRNSSPKERIILSYNTDSSYLLDVEFKSQNEMVEINLKNIKYYGANNTFNFKEVLFFDSYIKKALNNISEKKAGIILTNYNNSNSYISASSIILSMNPEAIFIPSILNIPDLEQLIKLSNENLFVIGSTCLDPIEQIWGFCSYLKKADVPTDSYLDKLRLSFVNKRVKRQCGACSKSTNVPSESFNKLPDIIKENLENTYMFSRGCSNCGYSSYNGFLDISSALLLDEQSRAYISHGSSESLILHAYKNGLRSLMEDGISKIYAGLTSFDEIFKECPQIPEGYIEAKKRLLNSRSVSISNSIDEKNNSSSFTMLIVEDDINQREVLNMVFSSEGYSVTLVENGKLALDALRNSNYDIILSDVMMPVMNGIDFVKHVKSNSATKCIPILMLTAVTSPEDEYEVLSYGADDYCDKNSRKKILIKRVERLLKDKKAKTTNPLGHLLS